MICVTPRAMRRIGQTVANEIGQRDRHRLHVALGDVELEHRRGRIAGASARERTRGRAGAQREQAATVQAERSTCDGIRLIIASACRFECVHPPIMSRGSKVISMSFHCS